ncbi:MAG: NepR family anti-sigma factor [Aestuariivirga sp.]
MADEDKKTQTAKPNKKHLKMNHPPAAPGKPQISDLIGDRLRTYYDEVASQPVPGRFLDLLDQLEAKSRGKKV